MALQTINSYLYAGCTSRIVGHVELSVSATNKRPVDQTRWPGYDQHNPADVALHVAYLKSLGVQVLMFNTYAVGSFENISLGLYLSACQAAGMGICINGDKGIYDGTPDPQAAIAAYMTWVRQHCFSLSMYEKYQGKYLVTFFTLPSDNPAWFRAIEAQNPDCLFVYDNPAMGPNTMDWVQADLAENADWWVRTYGLSGQGLQIPCVSPGFNDTVMQGPKACSVWSAATPARVWPAGGPTAATLASYFAVFNKYYSPANQPPYLQIVTVNDWDEYTAVEGRLANGVFTGGYFAPIAPPAPTLSHGELWIDGAKYGEFAPGNHAVTVVSVYSDGSVKKTGLTYTV